MKSKLSTLIILGFIILTGCSAVKHSDIILSKYDVGNVKMGEFEKKYAESVGGVEKAKKDSLENYKQFLKLYTDYKLKLRNAKIRGYENLPSIKKEYENYFRDIGESYVIDRELVKPKIDTLYQRGKYEVRASHILIRTDKRGDKKAKELAQAIIDSLNKGANFAEFARKYSEHAYTKNEGGDLYYITVNQILPAIEDVIYNTPVGKVYPKPVKTAYGYHIIKVTEKNPRIYKIRASHILVKYIKKDGKIDTTATKKKAEEIYEKIKNGADFEKLAKEYSDDKTKVKNSGDLGYFQRRQMVKPFDEAAFKLKPGEISKPVQTRFGFHIIKVTEIKPYPPFEKMKKKLKEKYMKTRYKKDLGKFTENLKKKFHYNLNTKRLSKIAGEAKNVKFIREIFLTPFYKKNKNAVIFSLNNNHATLDTLIKFGINDDDTKGKKIDYPRLKQIADKLAGKYAFYEEAKNLLKTDSTFAALMDEYKNGLLIFRLQQEEVWDKINIDSNEVRNLYNKNPNNCKTERKVIFDMIYSKNDSLIAAIYKELKQGKMNIDTLIASIENGELNQLKIKRNSERKILGNQVASAVWSLQEIGDFTSPLDAGGVWGIARLVKKLPQRIKTFEECFPEMVSKYQDIQTKKLTEEFNKRLEDIYNVEYYYDELEKAYKPDEN